MKIRILTPFLAGRERFESGDLRTVPDDVAGIYIANGWAVDAAAEPTAAPTATTVTDLAIENGALAQESRHG